MLMMGGGAAFGGGGAGGAGGGSLQDRNKAVARRVFDDIFNRGKLVVANEIYAADFVNHGLHTSAGLREDQEAVRGWRKAAPDLVMTVDQMIAEGDKVCVLWTGRGTNTGEGNGLPATGKHVEMRGITLWRLQDGKIREEWSEFDMLGLLRQTGLLPAQ
jgi:steroid delta-isomerase-like uncharacterized protein